MASLPLRVIVGATLACTLLFSASPAPAETAETAGSPEAAVAEAPPVTVPAPGPGDPSGHPSGRPKVCVVLSGGGARGAAHIGVLKVLDQLRVPVDCIAGTSMGALVGAGYAAGNSPQFLEQFAGQMSTELLFKERPPRKDLSNRRKEDDRTILFGPEFGLNGWSVQLPKGIVSGVQLETQLRAVAPVRGYVDFDELGIPYRAVATDLVTGKAVVFTQGELANVMRASLSVPGVIAPAEIDGQMLVDGGLTDNLPVDVARSMGADVVIAVNLGTSLAPREQLNSILGVTGQVINILTEQNVQASIASLHPDDILILPELGDFSAGDFDHLSETIPIGEAAAWKVADRLRAYSLPPEEYAALRARQQRRPAQDNSPAVEIVVAGAERVNPEVTVAQMETRPGQPIDPVVLEQDMRRLFGTGDFEHVNYRIIDGDDGRIVSVQTTEKSWGPDYLRFGLGLSSDLQGDSYFQGLLSYRQTWLNPLGAEWRTDVQGGRTTGIASEFYQPLQLDQYIFVAPRVLAQRTLVGLFQGNTQLGDYSLVTYLAGLDLGSQFSKYGEFRFGIIEGSTTADVQTGPPGLLPAGGYHRQGALRTQLVIDQLDSIDFPREGYGSNLYLFASRPGLGADDNYNRWSADIQWAYSFGNNTFNFGAGGAGNLGTNPLPDYDNVQWGGFLRGSGYRTDALLGQRLAFGRVLYYRRLLSLPLFEGSYVGGSLELQRMADPLVPGSPTGSVMAGSAFLATDSPIGAIYLGYGRAEGNENSFYLYVGRVGL